MKSIISDGIPDERFTGHPLCVCVGIYILCLYLHLGMHVSFGSFQTLPMYVCVCVFRIVFMMMANGKIENEKKRNEVMLQ